MEPDSANFANWAVAAIEPQRIGPTDRAAKSYRVADILAAATSVADPIGRRPVSTHGPDPANSSRRAARSTQQSRANFDHQVRKETGDVHRSAMSTGCQSIENPHH